MCYMYGILNLNIYKYLGGIINYSIIMNLGKIIRLAKKIISGYLSHKNIDMLTPANLLLTF